MPGYAMLLVLILQCGADAGIGTRETIAKVHRREIGQGSEDVEGTGHPFLRLGSNFVAFKLRLLLFLMNGGYTWDYSSRLLLQFFGIHGMTRTSALRMARCHVWGMKTDECCRRGKPQCPKRG